MNKLPVPGIDALIFSSGISGREIDSEKIAYVLAPRINAAGRIGSARIAFDILSGDITDMIALRACTDKLCEMNKQRQALQKAVEEQVVALVPDTVPKCIVMYDKNWDIGVLGLAASCLSRKYARPAVLLGENGGQLSGSARSIEGINIFEAILANERYLTRFGGHAQAAGLSMEKSSFRKFHAAFLSYIDSTYDDKYFVLRKYYDLEANISDLDNSLVNDIKLLAPFGMDNPVPLFLFKGVNITEKQSLNGGHTRFVAEQGGKTIKCIAFGVEQECIADNCDIIAAVTVNDYTGKAELVIDYIN